jgi:hypothetical protein
LLGPVPIRRFGLLAIDCLLGATGIKLLAVEDADAMARIKKPAGAAPEGAEAPSALHKCDFPKPSTLTSCGKSGLSVGLRPLKAAMHVHQQKEPCPK